MRKIEVGITINTTPARVIQAFMDFDILQGWLGIQRALVEKRVGGAYTLAWQVALYGIGYICTGTIKAYESDRLLEIGNYVYLSGEEGILGPMTLTVSAERVNGCTQVDLCQDGYQQGGAWDGYYDEMKEAWPEMMMALKEYLEK